MLVIISCCFCWLLLLLRKRLDLKRTRSIIKLILNNIDIKNYTCHYFDDTIKIEDFDINNILLEVKSYENILVYDIP